MRRLGPLALLLWTACSGEVDTGRTGRVLVVHAEPGVDVTVEADRLLFPVAAHPDLLGLLPGDVIVSDRGVGFLRRVVSVERSGESIAIATSPGELGDVIADGRVHQELSATAGKRDGSGGFTGFDVQLTGARRLKNDVDLQVDLVGGHFHFDPDLTIEAVLADRRVERFTTTVTGSLDAELSAEVAVDGNLRKDFVEKVWRQEHIALQIVGGIPVVEVIELSVGLGFTIEAQGKARVRVGGRARGTLSAGALYQHPEAAPEGDWEAVRSQEVIFTPSFEVLSGEATFAVSGGIFAQVEVRLYDMVGPAIRIQPYVELTHTTGTPDWQPAVGLRGNFEALVKLPFFEERYWKPFRAELFDLRKPFAPVRFGESPAPVSCGTVTATGFCTEGIAIRCDQGELEVTDCAAQGLGCEVPASPGHAVCAPGCGELDYRGGCADGSLRWCEAGMIRTYECPIDGPGCGWIDDSVGYNCL